MTITYSIEKDDLVFFRKYYQKNDSTYKIVFYIILFCYAIISFINSFKYFNYLPYFVFRFIFEFAIFFLLLKLVLFLISKFSDWSYFKPDKQKGVICEHTITLTEDYFVERTIVNENKHAWSGIIKITQDKKYIFVYIAVNNAYQIPKKAFQNSKQSQEFFEYAQLLFQEAKKYN